MGCLVDRRLGLLFAGLEGLALLLGTGLVYQRVKCQQYFPLDGFTGCYLPLIFEEDTQYATGYSHVAFRKVQARMSTEQVLALLGSPLEKYEVEGAREGWRWTRSPGDRSYRVRVVIFEERRVAEIINYFYVD